MFPAWRRLFVATALALLSATGVALATETFAHTDDGCVVETHCVACVWHRAATVVPAVVPAPSAPVEIGRVVAVPAPAPHLVDASLETPSRAPPRA